MLHWVPSARSRAGVGYAEQSCAWVSIRFSRLLSATCNLHVSGDNRSIDPYCKNTSTVDARGAAHIPLRTATKERCLGNALGVQGVTCSTVPSRAVIAVAVHHITGTQSAVNPRPNSCPRSARGHFCKPRSKNFVAWTRLCPMHLRSFDSAVVWGLGFVSGVFGLRDGVFL